MNRPHVDKGNDSACARHSQSVSEHWRRTNVSINPLLFAHGGSRVKASPSARHKEGKPTQTLDGVTAKLIQIYFLDDKPPRSEPRGSCRGASFLANFFHPPEGAVAQSTKRGSRKFRCKEGSATTLLASSFSSGWS